MIVVVTGNAGTGKSSFVTELMRLLPGFSLFCHDTVVRELYDTCEVRGRLEGSFGCSTRAEVAALLDADPTLVARLADIFRGPLMERLQRAGLHGGRDLVLDIPMFFEQMSGIIPDAEEPLIVGLACDEELRRRRLLGRGVSAGRVETLARLQMGQDEKLARCDYVAYNNEGLAELHAQAGRVAAIACRCREVAGLLAAPAGGCGLVPAMVAMDSPGRHYHDGRHVVAMLTGLADLEPHNARALQLAVLWHDHVYSTAPAELPHNEARSAAAMLRCLGRSGDQGALGIAAAHIRTTAGHEPGQGWPFSVDCGLAADNRLLLDLDLAVLSAPWDEVLRWEDGIYQEYRAVCDDAAYRAGRLGFLHRAAGRRVYHSPWFAGREGRAHTNLSRLVEVVNGRHQNS